MTLFVVLVYIFRKLWVRFYLVKQAWSPRLASSHLIDRLDLSITWMRAAIWWTQQGTTAFIYTATLAVINPQLMQNLQLQASKASFVLISIIRS